MITFLSAFDTFKPVPTAALARRLLLTLALVAAILPSPLTVRANTSSETLRVGVYHNPPKLLQNQHGQVSGIVGDLLRTIAEREGWQLEAVACHWLECLNMLEAGEIDIMPDVAISEPRSDTFDFHKTPVLLSWSQIYAARGQRMATLLDLDSKRVAILSGSIQQSYLLQLADSFELDVQWIVVDSLNDGFIAVENGKADAVAANHFLGDQQAYQRNLNATPIMFQPSKLFYAATATKHTSVLITIDSYLRNWQADERSVYFETLRRWGIERTRRGVPAVFWWFISALVVALVLTIGFNQLLRRKVAEKTRSLRNSEHRLNTILNSVDAYIYIKDLNLRYEYVNRKVCDLLGRPAEHIIGQTDQEFFDQKTCENLLENDLRVIKQGERVVGEEINNVIAEGKTHTFLSVKLPLRNADDSIYALCGISTDITEHRHIQDQLHQLAFFDPLTHLANRRLVLDRINHAIIGHASTGFEGALLLIDIDNFKTLNDTLGHDMGDLLLKAAAQRLEQQLRKTDSTGRLGADEFVIILEDLSRNPEQAMMDARNQAQAVLEELARPYDLSSVSYVVSVSVGVAMFSDAQGSVETLLKDADLALAEAKTAGRNTLRFFSPVMQTQVNRRSQLESALRRAIETNQLALHVQPQLNSDEKIVGMEALLRWSDPELGPISPADFIPIAEASSLIVPLGEWVLEHACALLAEWSHIPAMKHLTLAVNISAKQFRHSEFVNHLEGVLQATQINPAQLELEVTESLLIDDTEGTIARMHQLRARGIRFSLDDFGTGYSSLGYLKRLPLSQLKIDQSFVRDLLTDPNDEAIIRTIIALGQSLELQVIAEGVETAEQAQRLRELGCGMYQGYWFGKPKAAAEWQTTLIHNAETTTA